MLTGKKSPFDKVRGAMSGCDDYLTKPPEEARLKKILLKSIVAMEMQRDDVPGAGFDARQAIVP
jgi:twitching motility two-component system response regulator PilG